MNHAPALELVPTTELLPVVTVAVAPQSDSNFYVGFEGEVGVFCATYDTLPIGTRVEVELCLPGGVTLEREATVAFVRDTEETENLWPGLGLRFDRADTFLVERAQSFMRFRDPLFVPTLDLVA